MTREELIAALEAATGPSKQLNSAIHAEMRREGWTPEEWARTVAELDNPSIVNVPAYTASIDAAVTLVPDGAGVELRRYWLTTGIADAVCVALGGSEDGRVWSALIAWGTDGQTAEAEDKPTGAIAICIAALRARA